MEYIYIYPSVFIPQLLQFSKSSIFSAIIPFFAKSLLNNVHSNNLIYFPEN